MDSKLPKLSWYHFNSEHTHLLRCFQHTGVLGCSQQIYDKWQSAFNRFKIAQGTISTVSMPISWGVLPDLVAKPLVRSVSMKPGEQLVLVIFGNLEIFRFKSYLEFLDPVVLHDTSCPVLLCSSWRQPCSAHTRPSSPRTCTASPSKPSASSATSPTSLFILRSNQHILSLSFLMMRLCVDLFDPGNKLELWFIPGKILLFYLVP